MDNLISVIVPCFNNEKSIAQCLTAIYQSEMCHYEVIVVDDSSVDKSVTIIRQFPCKLIALDKHRGAAYARNIGARAAMGDILFFTDADCVLQKKTLAAVSVSFNDLSDKVIVGGTYTPRSYDNRFFSNFQSIFIHYAEMKHPVNPDYIATHAMAISRQVFNQFKGFNNYLFPILEDVEYCHRLKRQEVRMRINPLIQVQHIFNFSFIRSMKNAIRKTKYWTAYSLDNREIFSDSGTASYELKSNVISYIAAIVMTLLFVIYGESLYLVGLMLAVLCNSCMNFRFIMTMHHSYGLSFTLRAMAYYLFVYPVAVILGSIIGVFEFLCLQCFAKEIG